MFVLEYADDGTLRSYLKDNFNKLDWNVKLQFAIQIADAVSYIHQNNIIHRDLVSIYFLTETLNLHALNHFRHILTYSIKIAF